MRVPFLDLGAQHDALRGEIRAAVDDVFEQQAFVLGASVAAFEREMAGFCEARRAVGCASGSDALLLSLHALGVGPGDDVICPAFTFFATAGAVARLGARPIFADIDPVTLCLDPAAARTAAGRCTRLRALLAVHLYGRTADNDALLALAADCGIPLIEDAALAIGARDASGRRVGGRGRAVCFSFYPTKNLGGAGDGGLVTTDDDALADRLATLRVHGSPRRYHHDEVGINSRLDAVQAAVLRVKLPHLDAWNAARGAHVRAYDEAFAKAGALPASVPLAAGGLPLRTPEPCAPPARSAHHIYAIRVPADRRDALRTRLTERGIGNDVYYPLGLHQQPCFANLPSVSLPETEAAARELLALPLYPELRDDQREHVVASVLAALAG
jgi:dTDP-4-amino-4,6-dideoxygalactose transaminase